MAKKEWKQKVSNQISVFKNNKSLLELINVMVPASPLFPFHLHAEKNAGEKARSLIRLVMVDYSKQESLSVYANLRPEDIKYLYCKMAASIPEVSLSQMKIFKAKEQKDPKQGMVTKVTINRNEVDRQGRKRNYPWYVEIQNGTGRIAYNGNGGQFIEEGTYKKKKGVSINMTDLDSFAVFSRANTVIEGFERDVLVHRRDVENLSKLLKSIKKYIDELWSPNIQGDSDVDKAA